MEIFSLSTGRNILLAESRDRERMRLYASKLTALHIVVLTRRVHGYSSAPIHEGNLHIYPTHSRSRLHMLLDAFLIARSILVQKQANPTVISSQDPLELGMLGYVLSRLFKIPLHVQVHGDYYSAEWQRGSLVRNVRLVLLRFVLGRARGIRVVSERIKKSFEQHGIDTKKVTVLPIRPELDMFMSVARTRDNDGYTVILTASRLEPEKDLSRLISAFALLKKAHPSTHLRIVGRGSEETRLRTQVKEYGLEDSVTLVPWTEHVEEEMVNADIFALASKHEAYGLVLIESLAAGVPVVTTDVGCVGEVVHDGTHGIVVRDPSVEAYAAALTRMCSDIQFRQKASEAGRLLGKELSHKTADRYAEEWVAAHTL